MQSISWYASVLVLSLTVAIGNGEAICSYKYELQPAGIPVNEQCTLEGYHQLLELKCQVTGMASDQLTIHWHHSIDPPTENDSKSAHTTINPAVGSHLTVESQPLESLESGGVSVVSVLTIDVSKVSNEYYLLGGFYWCSVNSSTSSNVPMLNNPSQVLNISTVCFEMGDPTREKCTQMSINLFERVQTNTTRCADFPASIDIVNAWDAQLCTVEETNKPQTTTNSLPGIDLTSTDKTMAIEGATTTPQPESSTKGGSSLEQSTTRILPLNSDGVSMQYVWIGVGIAIVVLLLIIVVTLIVIVCLTYRKNKVKVSSSPHNNNINNPYIEYSNTDTLKKETFVCPVGPTPNQQHPGSKFTGEDGTEVQYETINVVHAHNPTFGGEGSPGSRGSPRTTNTIQVSLSSTGEYEDVTAVMDTRGSLKASQRHQYDLVESEEPPEYSHLQHAHGGSLKLKISTNSSETLPSSSYNSRERSSLVLSTGGHKQLQPLFDNPEYMSIGERGSRQTQTLPRAVNVGEGLTGYGRINRTNSSELNYPTSEDYRQLPSVFTEGANNLITRQQGRQISLERWNNRTTMASHPPAHRHHSATVDGTGSTYASIDPNTVKKRNTYSFSIVSTDDRYVSERGHVYHVLEQTDKQRQNSFASDQGTSSPRFRIQEEGVKKGRDTGGRLPSYSNVIKSSKQAQEKQNEEIEMDDVHLRGSPVLDSVEGNEDGYREIPAYSQVDKSKKKNKMHPQVEELDLQESDTHHYHVLEHSNPVNIDTHHYHVLEESSRSKNAIDLQNSDTHHYHIPEEFSRSPKSQAPDTHHYHVLEQPRQSENATETKDPDIHNYHVLEQPSQCEDTIDSLYPDTHHYHVLEQVKVEEQDWHNDTHHYHVLEQRNDVEKVDESCGELGGPIYHTIDRHP